MSTFTPSAYQQAIFDFVEHGRGNAIIKAVAGSGKTTTIVHAMSRARGSSIFLAFNKAIAEELKRRGVNARTFHSLTYAPVTRARGAVVNTDKLLKLVDANWADEDIWNYGVFARKMVGLARQSGIGCLLPDTDEHWFELAAHHDLEPEREGATLSRGIELARGLLALSNAQRGTVDFDDLLYCAVAEGVTLPKFDFVFVDEAQDTNAIQRAILRKILRPGARVIAVGDPAQAIYGFRGADSDSMDLIAREFECVTLPLTVSYRCPRAVVAEAQRWVPEIEPAPTAPEGAVVRRGGSWRNADFAAGELVVCRTTKPLIALAYRLIRDKIPATVLGREIGQGLLALIKRLNAHSIDELIERLEAFTRREYEKAIAAKNETKAAAVEDKSETLQVLIASLTEDNRTIDALRAAIDHLFAEKCNAVILATIHKAKGLEAERVYWLNSSKCPAKWAKQPWQQGQERNLCYVAITRAQRELVLIEAAEDRRED